MQIMQVRAPNFGGPVGGGVLVVFSIVVGDGWSVVRSREGTGECFGFLVGWGFVGEGLEVLRLVESDGARRLRLRRVVAVAVAVVEVLVWVGGEVAVVRSTTEGVWVVWRARRAVVMVGMVWS